MTNISELNKRTMPFLWAGSSLVGNDEEMMIPRTRTLSGSFLNANQAP